MISEIVLSILVLGFVLFVVMISCVDDSGTGTQPVVNSDGTGTTVVNGDGADKQVDVKGDGTLTESVTDPAYVESHIYNRFSTPPDKAAND